MLAFLIQRSVARSLTDICYQCTADVCVCARSTGAPTTSPIIRPVAVLVAERMTARPDHVYRIHARAYMRLLN